MASESLRQIRCRKLVALGQNNSVEEVISLQVREEQILEKNQVEFDLDVCKENCNETANIDRNPETRKKGFVILEVEEKISSKELKERKQKYVQNEYNVIDTTLRENYDSPHNILISESDSFSLDSSSLHSYSNKSHRNNISLESLSQKISSAGELEYISPSLQESEDEDFIDNTPDRDFVKRSISPYTDESDDDVIHDDSTYIPSVEFLQQNSRNYLFASSDTEFNVESSNSESENSQIKRKYVISPTYYEDSDDASSKDNNILSPSSNKEQFSLRRSDKRQYIISPVHSNESDVDLSDDDPTYIIPRSNTDTIASDSENDEVHEHRGRKRRNPDIWKQNVTKKLRNSGKEYISMSKTRKLIPQRCIKPPCTEKCRLKCSEKIDANCRRLICDQFWGLGDLYKQRAFIKSSMVDVTPKYKYTNAENPRQPNKSYYFTVNGKQIRVCKTFFKNTLDVSDRMIFTIQQKTNNNDFLTEDKRGKHNNHKTTNPELVADISAHRSSGERTA